MLRLTLSAESFISYKINIIPPDKAPPRGIPCGYDPGTGRQDMCVFDVHRGKTTPALRTRSPEEHRDHSGGTPGANAPGWAIPSASLLGQVWSHSNAPSLNRRVFRQLAWLEAGSVKAAWSRPAWLMLYCPRRV
jgi:hypothetical protein